MALISDFSEPGGSGSRLGSSGYGTFLRAFSDVASPVGGYAECVDSALEKRKALMFSAHRSLAWYVRAPRGKGLYFLHLCFLSFGHKAVNVAGAFKMTRV